MHQNKIPMRNFHQAYSLRSPTLKWYIHPLQFPELGAFSYRKRQVQIDYILLLPLIDYLRFSAPTITSADSMRSPCLMFSTTSIPSVTFPNTA